VTVKLSVISYGSPFLEVLKWAREQHCPSDTYTCNRAAMFGHLARGVLTASTLERRRVPKS